MLGQTLLRSLRENSIDGDDLSRTRALQSAPDPNPIAPGMVEEARSIVTQNPKTKPL
ncbi:MAG: hypothetical protein JWQ49_4478 [Edaphobacter sp.]|nr:hypothetical protein [Edaphobacter sp.]